MTLAISVRSNRASVLLSGSFHWVWDLAGKNFLGRALQALLGCRALGSRGSACQELWLLGPSAAVHGWAWGFGARAAF